MVGSGRRLILGDYMLDWEVEIEKGGVVLVQQIKGETAADVIEDILHNESDIEIRRIKLVKTL